MGFPREANGFIQRSTEKVLTGDRLDGDKLAHRLPLELRAKGLVDGFAPVGYALRFDGEHLFSRLHQNEPLHY
jgi:hypothetical protein